MQLEKVSTVTYYFHSGERKVYHEVVSFSQTGQGHALKMKNGSVAVISTDCWRNYEIVPIEQELQSDATEQELTDIIYDN